MYYNQHLMIIMRKPLFAFIWKQFYIFHNFKSVNVQYISKASSNFILVGLMLLIYIMFIQVHCTGSFVLLCMLILALCIQISSDDVLVE